MRYLTDRKRAEGLGASKAGTEHHWYMNVSGVGLTLLIPFFVFILGTSLGAPYEEVVATLSQPFPAVIVGLTIAAGMLHFRRGAQMMIEDYWGGMTRKVMLWTVICLSYLVMAAGLYAIVRIAI
ncbi:succinate dehydrogenase, hydrophobic membrane anchor protein [Rhodovulum sp. BSW8]|uniref:Succinate dehydrogenase hydrophobic membrane anchor subunit n=1 Tax=Rhodovulum visakhapatnamense TaxID=364297 RepID=A0ABS1RC75_9RHOB|nr:MULTISPECIES: succinate dehydrogenase, hydrophobic membrane anchor protein [Rhodovulum]MBL3568712.1 succinate dehydrogenase, hydrophobic membrane anchor protein [Rhodovulum visakhapatnamense]MBL3577233.1 succinate dehydrogenase, hydrophobic membrane anchor protein [Rhodovulum visakhapatnamense]OLS45787.1 succinate dehydrogenase, hydrophobic membrane anchor protein [Rhodovulum sulfidophilum]RBO52125.1 succinate dehydrogenase, hydrophobic membrane anchor protein [Rhodovulum sp. BSW8]